MYKRQDNYWLGFLAAAVVGMIFAGIVALGSIRLGQSQVAIGFVLALLGDDLSAFLGQNYTRMSGAVVPKAGIPLLKDLPVVGPLFFDQNIVVYFAIVLVFVTWWWLNRTQAGLQLRGAGERPTAAFARGVNVNRVRYLYTILGGALVGIAGAAYSLNVKIGWSDGHVRGFGWIALAIVIFGGWRPYGVLFGALLFSMVNALQLWIQALNIPIPFDASELLIMLPYVLTILVLMFSAGRVRKPSALGVAYERES